MFIEPVDNTETPPVSSVARLSRLEGEFASKPVRLPTVTHRDRQAEEELDRWLEDPVGVERSSDSTPRESVRRVSGNMVKAQRTTLADHNIDMCSFLNRNRDFVDLLQCEEIPKGRHHLHTIQLCPSVGP
ncbi:hypothetical protein L914_02660 [Phytophthora nicotianae]|uniref:Uncharacterized protein n=1 Tax=Phytophthora nicotianae TaxID=4792 RepID=W2P1V2_PHYNI|nr:hypothetical protein L914_02660 [Phytophthora nicotianae]